MFYRKAVWRFVLMIASGVVLFFLDYNEVAGRSLKLFFLFALAVVKAVYFVYLNLDILRATAGRHFDFTKYLLFFGISVSMMILSFAIDYFCLYRIESTAFANIPADSMPLEQAIAFCYFSLATFSTAGFGDIYPTQAAGRVLVSLELLMFLVTTVLILSNIHPLRESLGQREKPKPESK
ncbi:MAG: two pore domain potassium channel family protein [Saprospiraceae bacterium]|nr:two pore domain potassium channel family protein [Saprospiraceae bacterium]